MQVWLYSKWFAATLVSYVQICSQEYFLHRCKCVYTARYGYLSFVNYLLMSKARRMNKAFREWLAFRCHTHGLLDQGRWVNILPTVGNYVGSIMTLSQCHLSTLTNNTASKMPTLAQRMTVIWCYHHKMNILILISLISSLSETTKYFFPAPWITNQTREVLLIKHVLNFYFKSCKTQSTFQWQSGSWCGKSRILIKLCTIDYFFFKYRSSTIRCTKMGRGSWACTIILCIETN
mgnify:CR=1 FL=1